MIHTVSGSRISRPAPACRSPWPFACVLALLVCAVSPLAAHDDGAAVVLDATLDMVCFPPNLGNPPPCVVPAGIDPAQVSPDPTGEMRIRVFDDDVTAIRIDLEGIAPSLVLTAWIVYFPPTAPPPDPIFEPAGPGLPPIAGNSVPLAPTFARFSDGLGGEPNLIRVRSNGKARLRTILDYNPLAPNQGLLRNGMVDVTQNLAPAGSGAEQPDCCAGLGMPRPQPVASAFLRRFDPATGFQMLDAYGRPELLRSPVPGFTVAIVAHIDGTTHGLNPGVPIPPIPGIPVTAGDHYVVGLFPLQGLAAAE